MTLKAFCDRLTVLLSGSIKLPCQAASSYLTKMCTQVSASVRSCFHFTLLGDLVVPHSRDNTVWTKKFRCFWSHPAELTATDHV